jgi:hypothetical protein
MEHRTSADGPGLPRARPASRWEYGILRRRGGTNEWVLDGQPTVICHGRHFRDCLAQLALGGWHLIHRTETGGYHLRRPKQTSATDVSGN